MNNNKIKEIRSLYQQQKNYLKALELFLELTPLEKKKVNISLDELLYDYFFNGGGSFCAQTEKKLLNQFPDNFIQAVRTSQVFLQDDRFELLKTYNLKKHSIHQQVWEFLRERDSKLWKDIKVELKSILHVPIEEVLIYLTFWIEEQRFQQNSRLGLAPLASVYSFFIKLYLHETDKVLGMSEYEFSKLFTEHLNQDNKNPLHKILKLIHQWISFNQDELQVYCFALDIDVQAENGVIYFNQSPLNYYKWQLDGIRYEKTRIDYYQKANKMVVMKMAIDPNCIPCKDSSTFDLNFGGAVKQQVINLILRDLQLNNFEWKGEKAGLLKVFFAISGYSHNRYNRYEAKLEMLIEKHRNWYVACKELFEFSLQQHIQIDPYLLHTEKEFVDIVHKTMFNFSQKLIEQAFTQLSYRVNKDKYKFDRFNHDYDVWLKPFVKVGNAYFSPIAFFVNNDWIYSAAQVAIKNLQSNKNVRKETATAMEKYLADKFRNKGFKVKHVENNQASKVDGDVDIIIEDKDIILFIQLKRTYLRLDLKNAYYEYVKSDKKASLQLNKAEKYFENPNDIFQVQHQPIKWIVSTSYEHVNNQIDNCNKINYFDLLFALEKTELKSLEDIIYYLESNSNLLDFYIPSEHDDKLLQGLGLPLDLVEPKKYRQVLAK